MRDPARIDRVVDQLRAAWKVNPDLRLGQLVQNVLGHAIDSEQLADRVWCVEDDVWESAFVRWAREQAGKHVEPRAVRR